MRQQMMISVAAISISKSKIEIAKFSLCRRFFSTIFHALYEQHLNCIFSVHAICTVHNYFIIVTYLAFERKKKTFFVHL